jgi:hypothetical protein
LLLLLDDDKFGIDTFDDEADEDKRLPTILPASIIASQRSDIARITLTIHRNDVNC